MGLDSHQIRIILHIFLGEDGRTLLLRVQPEGGYRLGTNGRIHDQRLIAYIMACGVTLPARYTVAREENEWIATLEEPVAPKVDLKKPRAGPRQRPSMAFSRR